MKWIFHRILAIRTIKDLDMKYIKRNYQAFLFTGVLIAALGLSGCNFDEEDPVTPKTLDQYKTEMDALVASETDVVENCVVGYNDGDFRSATLFEEYSTNYLTALNIAEDMLKASDLTIADVMDANYLISPPGKLFNDEVFKSDRRPLDELIRYCDTLRVNTPIGTEPGAAPQDAHDQFDAAINSAEGVRSRMSTIERQVVEAVDELNLELEIFEDAIVK